MEGEQMELTPKKIVAIAYDMTLTTVKAKNSAELATCLITLDLCMEAFDIKTLIVDWIKVQAIEAYATRTIPSTYEMLMDLVQKVKI